MTISPSVYQAVVLARALDLYAATGIKANRAYTPSAMMRTASAITGQTFKRRDYRGASVALMAHADKLAAEFRTAQHL